MTAGILKIRLDLLMIKGKYLPVKEVREHVAHEVTSIGKIPRQTEPGDRTPESFSFGD